mmetsp:Transcript_8762/g.21589  ORF Transcript_8762/g.21589 Transcript_8762/m.21589 type:complete len:207 (+) Transcript_8762:284-904(+)
MQAVTRSILSVAFLRLLPRLIYPAFDGLPTKSWSLTLTKMAMMRYGIQMTISKMTISKTMMIVLMLMRREPRSQHFPRSSQKIYLGSPMLKTLKLEMTSLKSKRRFHLTFLKRRTRKMPTVKVLMNLPNQMLEAMTKTSQCRQKIKTPSRRKKKLKGILRRQQTKTKTRLTKRKQVEQKKTRWITLTRMKINQNLNPLPLKKRKNQ